MIHTTYDIAQRKYGTRSKLRGRKLVFSIEMKETAISLLEEDYNPEQIKGRSNVEELAKHQEIAEKLEIYFYFCKQ